MSQTPATSPAPPADQAVPADVLAAVSPLRLRRVAIDTYRENVAYLNRDCAVYRAEGFQALSKVEVRANGRRILATLNVTSDPRIVQCHEVGLSEDAFDQLGVPKGHPVTISQAEPPASIAALHRKIDGERLGRADFESIVRDIAEHRYSKIELSAFVVATNRGELDREEVYFLTEAMIASGRRIDWHERLVVDKHCIGGIPGNRTSMLVVPIVAAHGLVCPKTSFARHHLAGRHRRHHGGAGRCRAAAGAPAGNRARAPCLPGLGRNRRPVAGRRRADLGRAPALARLAGPDGGFHPVEEDRRRLEPPGARHPDRADRQGALDARGAEAAPAVRICRAPARPLGSMS